MESLWFLALVVVAWFGITGLLAQLSGWASLAHGLRATLPASGERFRFASGSMGAKLVPVNYGGCLFVTVGEAGIRLSLLLPFRFRSPALFIAWSQMESVTERRLIFSTCTAIRVRDRWPTITVRGRAGQFIRAAYAHLGSQGALRC